MGFGFFGSSNESKTKSSATDNRIGADGNAVVYTPKFGHNARVDSPSSVITLGRDASLVNNYTTTNGIDEEAFDKEIGDLGNFIADSLNRKSPPGNTIEDSASDRLETQTKEAPEEEKQKQTALISVVVLLALVAMGVLLLGRGKKS